MSYKRYACRSSHAPGGANFGPANGGAAFQSDYYYRSEAAIAAITGGVMALAGEKGWDDFQIRDYMVEGLTMYANFNTALSNNRNIDEQWIIDPNIAPPRNFEWFYETGGSQANLNAITAIW